MQLIGRIYHRGVAQKGRARMFVVAGLAAGLLGALPTPAAASGFIIASGCPHHQAFIEGDDEAVRGFLPEGYAPVRTSSGAPLLFVRAIRCDSLAVGGTTA